MILTLKDNPVSAAFAHILATLLNIEWRSLDFPPISKQLKIPRESILILTENQINSLATFRAYNFAGAVLILTSNPVYTVKEKHRILRWGQDSHTVYNVREQILDLLPKIFSLVPLEPENLKMLQKELQAPKHWLQQQVIPILKRLPKHPEDLDAIANIISEIRASTPSACHSVIEIGGNRAQIQQHFQRLMNILRHSSTPDQDIINQLKQVFEQWRKIVLEAGEGLGTFSPNNYDTT